MVSAMLPLCRTLRIICLAGLFAGAFLILRESPGPVAQAAEDAGAQRAAYSKNVAAHYKLPFAEGRPFLPSNATTDTGEFIDPKSFPTAEYCGHCHQQAHAESGDRRHTPIRSGIRGM